MGNMDNPDQHPPTANSSSLVEIQGSMAEYVQRHFQDTLKLLKQRKESSSSNEWEGAKYSEVETM